MNAPTIINKQNRFHYLRVNYVESVSTRRSYITYACENLVP
jgi:hypothetical protein